MDYLHTVTLEIFIRLFYNSTPLVLKNFGQYDKIYSFPRGNFAADVEKYDIKFLKCKCYENYPKPELGLNDLVIELNENENGKEQLKEFLDGYIDLFRDKNLIVANSAPFRKHLLFILTKFKEYFEDCGNKLPLFCTLNAKELDNSLPLADSEFINYEKRPIELILYLEKKGFIKINKCEFNISKTEDNFQSKTFSVEIYIELLKTPDEISSSLLCSSTENLEVKQKNKVIRLQNGSAVKIFNYLKENKDKSVSRNLIKNAILNPNLTDNAFNIYIGNIRNQLSILTGKEKNTFCPENDYEEIYCNIPEDILAVSKT